MNSWTPGTRLAIAVIVAATAACTVAFSGLTIDDAFITFRFAQHARDGLGFVWNPGEPPVEGMTSLLWTALLVPFAGDKEWTYAWARALGVCANAAMLFLWIRLLLRRLGPRSACAPLWLLAACCPLLAFHSQNGLETALAVLCASALVAEALALLEGAGDPNVFGVLWLVAGATRPELVAYGACLAALAAWEIDRRARSVLIGRLLVSFVLPGTAFFLWRWHYFGHLLPLPFYAKRASGFVSDLGIKYVALTFLGLIGCVTLLGLLGLSKRSGRSLSAAHARLLVLPALLSCLGYVAFRPIMGFVYRYPTPFVVPLVVAAGATLAGNPKRRLVRALAVLGVLQLTSAIVPAWHFAGINSRATRAFHQRFGEALARLPVAGRLATFNDVGGPAFFSGWPTVEGAGLVTPSVSFDGATNRELVETFAPDVITVAADEGRIASATGEFPDYELVRAVPWLVFAGDGPRSYQCVLARRGYAHLARLSSEVAALGLPELARPWYFELYRRLKQEFG